MKKLILTLALLFSYVTLISQHKGNYDASISRQNISGNAIVYGHMPKHNMSTLNPNSTITIDVRALQNVKASVIHEDWSARVQTVEESENKSKIQENS